MPRLDMNTMKNFLETKINFDDINIIYDIGCLDGKDTILMSELFNAKAFGFEALKSNYKKFLLNNNNENVEFYNVIIRNYNGKTVFFEKEENGIHSVFEQNLSKTKSILKNLDCVRMDSFIKENNLPIPDLVKIDVEGATLEVLESFGDLLSSIKILQIETEEKEYFKGQTLEPEVLNFTKIKGFFEVFKTSAISVKQNDYLLLNKKYY